jgi:redox-sensitive bicupin YhaK (pirin superfamily)
MKTIIHTANSRGHANHGWLDAHHTFSFAGFYNPERVHFGALRVLNDDIVAPGKGFGMHPHDNMEIISIVLKGAIKHKDNMGNEGIVHAGEIQVMSAGTGVHHSEYNPSADEYLNLLQIWLFPQERQVTPRYDQKAFDPKDRQNTLQLVISPDGEAGSLWIQQQAWFSLGHLEAGKSLTYQSRAKGNGSYIFVISGELQIDGQTLGARDGMGINDFDQVTIAASNEAEFLIMDIPQ